ncbi:hypothetical protein Tco_0946437 [Tanacetum coccineum]
MLDSKAYKEYYVVVSRAEPPKPKIKYKKKADEPVTPSKSKTAPASKGSRLKSPAKVAKTAKKKQPAMMPKTIRLSLLSLHVEQLTDAEQIKLATKMNLTHLKLVNIGKHSDVMNKNREKEQMMKKCLLIRECQHHLNMNSLKKKKKKKEADDMDKEGEQEQDDKVESYIERKDD